MTAYIHTVSRKQSPINVGYSQLPHTSTNHAACWRSRRCRRTKNRIPCIFGLIKVDTTSGSWRHVPDSALLPNGHVTPPSYGAPSSSPGQPPHFFHFSSSSLRLIGRTGQRHDFRPGRLPKPGQFVPFLSLPLCPQTRSSAPSATLNPALVFL